MTLSKLLLFEHLTKYEKREQEFIDHWTDFFSHRNWYLPAIFEHEV